MHVYDLHAFSVLRFMGAPILQSFLLISAYFAPLVFCNPCASFFGLDRMISILGPNYYLPTFELFQICIFLMEDIFKNACKQTVLRPH